VTKQCSKCHETWPATAEYYGPDGRARDGLQSQCRYCRRASQRASYAADPEKCVARRMRYYWEHREAELAYSAAYHRANPEKIRRYQHRWSLRNPEKRREAHRNWRKRNAERSRAYTRSRQARLAGAAGRYTADDVTAQLQRQRGRCYWCEKKLGDSYHVDHVNPVARGGLNGPENIVVACPSCNLRKGAKHPMEWAGVLC